MTSVQIASDLELATVDLEETGYYHAVEFSQPIAMLDAARVKVSGVVQRIVGVGFQMAAIVESSNDLWIWHPGPAEYGLLVFGREPHAFVVGPLAGDVVVSHAYARVKWVLYPTEEALTANQRVLFSAHISTGL